MHPYLTVRETTAKALAHRGTQVSAIRYEWDIAGRCQAPVKVVMFGRDQKGRIFDYTPGVTKSPLELIMDAPCRKCTWCLRQRAKTWQERAYNEYLISSRCWFGTLTLNQEHRTLNLMSAHQLAKKAGFDLDSAAPALRSKYRHKANTPELARWLKRVRKNSDTRFRYLLCSENHSDGTPHYHVMIFESFRYSQVPKRVLDGAWRVGFSQFRLCDEKAAWYVTKYLAKDALSRVRASTRLGSGPPALRIAAQAFKESAERVKPDHPPKTTEEGKTGTPVVATSGGTELWD